MSEDVMYEKKIYFTFNGIYFWILISCLITSIFCSSDIIGKIYKQDTSVDSTSSGVILVVSPRKFKYEEGAKSSYLFSQNSAQWSRIYTFNDFPVKGGKITEVAFRAKAPVKEKEPLMPISIRSVKILFSTTKENTGNANSIYKNNSDSNTVRVYNGPAKLSTAFFVRKPGEPTAFDLRFRLQTPYLYKPDSVHNLKIFITVESGKSDIPALDADDKGPITQFTFGSFNVLASDSVENGKIGWIISGTRIIEMQKIKNPDGKSLVNHFFNNSSTMIIGKPSEDPQPQCWSASIPLAAYQSFIRFKNDLCIGSSILNQQQNSNEHDSLNTYAYGNFGYSKRSEGINPAVKVVMYDNEQWRLTPVKEQHNASDYYALFANLAHAYGYCFLSTPSPNIVPLQKGYNPNRDLIQQYHSMGFSIFCSNAPAEIYNLQTQTFEGFPKLFVSFINKSTEQAKSANPNILLFAGIGTDPAAGGNVSADLVKWKLVNADLPPVGSRGRRWKITARQIYTAVLETYKTVSGYWLNIADGDCKTAVEFLQLLKNDGF